MRFWRLWAHRRRASVMGLGGRGVGVRPDFAARASRGVGRRCRWLVGGVWCLIL